MQASVNCDDYPTVPYAGWSSDFEELIYGFCFDGWFSPGLIKYSFWYTQAPQYFETRALYQNEGIMDETAALRGLTLDGVDGYIALSSPATLGWKMKIRPSADQPYITVIQADVAKREHADFHAIANESGLELSWELATRYGVQEMVNEDGSRYLYGMEVCITNDNPLEVCTGDPVNFTEWWKENVRYVGDLSWSQAWDRNG